MHSVLGLRKQWQKQYIAIGKTDLFYNSMRLCGNFTHQFFQKPCLRPRHYWKICEKSHGKRGIVSLVSNKSLCFTWHVSLLFNTQGSFVSKLQPIKTSHIWQGAWGISKLLLFLGAWGRIGCEWLLNKFSFATAAEKQLKQRKHCKKHCYLVVGLKKVVFREGNCQGNRKLRADPA